MRFITSKAVIPVLLIIISLVAWFFWPEEGKIFIPKGYGHFTFQNDSIYYRKPILVYTYVPLNVNKNSRILILIHGAARKVEQFQSEWQEVADKYNVVLVSPYFSFKQFPHEYEFQLGNVFDLDIMRDRNDLDIENNWSFSFIDPIFEKVKYSLKNKNDSYYLYGHSAGAQFVHRFLFFKPNSKISKVIFANSGWYTRPNYSQNYPYGLGETNISLHSIAKAFARDVTVLLGENDTDKFHFQLKRNKTVDDRGLNRFERGSSYFNFCKHIADSMNTTFNWKLSTVPGIEHRNDMMAFFAGELFFNDKSTSK